MKDKIMNKGLYWVATRYYFKSIFYVPPNYRIEKISFLYFSLP
jgi:hypothetical protein